MEFKLTVDLVVWGVSCVNLLVLFIDLQTSEVTFGIDLY